MDPSTDQPVVRRIALVGLGSVGRALAVLVAERHEQIVAELGVDLRITGVMTRTLGLVDAADGLDLAELARGAASGGRPYDVREVGAWLEHSRADVLVEASVVDLDSGEPATGFLREALGRGIHGVTANKGPVVHAYRELTALADAHGVRFRFEAATADCLPIYNLYRESLPLDRPHRFRGMVNGTTTVILETIEAGGTYADGVAEAQRRGIAEADPSLDVDGHDAAVKVIAIANVLMGADLRLTDIAVTGIRDLDPVEARDAASAGTPIRLVAEIESVDGVVHARVAPERLDARDPFVRVGGDDLAVHFDGDLMPGITVVGHGLTPRETAYGVLSDIVGVLRGR
ncbi:homoserine dehydrogenase [Longivirga aurantiaca]|uniref:Homoserine dehydrogenase n=1 Tax=Longivirga aurantiaca TaxID=1837743 RepID=A0ABW1T498_9ACTN